MSASIDATSLGQMAFSELLAPVQLLRRRGRVLDAFVESLPASYYVIIASDISIGGAYLADPVCAYRYSDPLHPVLGNSGHGCQFQSFNK